MKQPYETADKLYEKPKKAIITLDTLSRLLGKSIKPRKPIDLCISGIALEASWKRENLVSSELSSMFRESIVGKIINKHNKRLC